MKNFIKEYTPFILAAIVGCLVTIMFYRVKEGIEEITDKRHIFIVDGVEEYSFISTSENAGTTRYRNHKLDSIIGNRYYYSEPKQGNIVVLGEGGSMRLAKPEDVDKKDIELGMVVSTDTIFNIDSIDLSKYQYYRVKFTGTKEAKMTIYYFTGDSLKVENINTSDLYKD